jgi:hypothetical protein
MKEHELITAVREYKLILPEENPHSATKALLALLDARLPQLLHRSEALQAQLGEKTVQNRHISKQLRKAASKLAKKEE